MKYSSSIEVGIWKVQNGRLYKRYKSSSTKEHSSGMQKAYRLHPVDNLLLNLLHAYAITIHSNSCSAIGDFPFLVWCYEWTTCTSKKGYRSAQHVLIQTLFWLLITYFGSGRKIVRPHPDCWVTVCYRLCEFSVNQLCAPTCRSLTIVFSIHLKTI